MSSSPAKDSSHRFLVGMIGHNRTGKTATARMIAQNWKRANGGDVIAFDPQNKFEGVRDYVISNKAYRDKEWPTEIAMQYSDCLVILDDYRMLMKGNQIPDAMTDLFALRAEKRIDIIYIMHSPKQMHNSFSFYTTHYYVFYTKFAARGWESKVIDYPTMLNALEFMNGYVKLFGRGAYPKFPHLLVDTEGDIIRPRNITVDEFRKVTEMIEGRSAHIKSKH